MNDKPFLCYDFYIKRKERFCMKREFIENVKTRMAHILDEAQLQELQMALSICLGGIELQKECTEVSVEVIDNYEYLRLFLQHMVVSGKSRGTARNYKRHIEMLFGDVLKPVREMTDDDLMFHLARQKYQRKLSNRYLEQKRIVFRSFFKWMRKKKYITESPADLLDPIKYDIKLGKPFKDEEREMLRCACKCERDWAILEFLYSTAARVSEVAALNIEDIDFDEMQCVVYGKGAKERMVYLNATAAYHLKKYLAERTDDNPALFVSSKKPYERLSDKGIEAVLRRLGKRTGVQKVHPHRYRRTALTNALNRGMPLQDAQFLAGHKSPETTMIYCTVDAVKVKGEHRMLLAS